MYGILGKEELGELKGKEELGELEEIGEKGVEYVGEVKKEKRLKSPFLLYNPFYFFCLLDL